MRAIMIVLALSFALVACMEEKGGALQEIAFMQVKDGDPLVKENEIVAQALADMSEDATAENSQLKVAVIDFKTMPLIAVRAEGDNWCGTMGCNTDFYYKKADGSFLNIGGASSDLPLYSLSCGGKNFVGFTVPLEDKIAIWQVTESEISVTDKLLSVDRSNPCQDLK